ncbi:MAG: SIR2 family NAD-dependent protein deacylase [Clostridia bacterium]
MNKRILAFTGAGISKDSGIPTFEEMGELRDKLSRRFFSSHPKQFFEVLLKLKTTIDKASPNKAHLILAKYEIPIITMNIDGLHTKANSEEVLEIHGNLEKLRCKKCNQEFDFKILKESYKCPECSSVLQPNVVLYGDGLSKINKAFNMVSECDILIIVGTSYYTSTAIDILEYAKATKKKIYEVNSDAKTKVPRLIKKIIHS